MLRRAMILLGSVLGCLGAWASGVAGSEAKIVPAAVVCAGDASFAERLAAGEIRRYVSLRTGRLLPVVDRLETASGGLIVVGSKSNKLVRTVLEPRPGANDRSAVSVQDLGPEQYLLADSLWKDRPILVVAGGDPIGTLYGAYRLAEHLGVRFYLHGDVIPDQKTPLALPGIHELRKFRGHHT